MKTFYSDETMEAIREIAKINADSGVPQETFVSEEASEFIKEWMKILRHKGDEEKLRSEAMDMASALAVFFERKGISHEEVEAHMYNKIRRAIALNQATGEV